MKNKFLILAAGRGKRLHPLTKDLPKGMVRLHRSNPILNQIRLCENLNVGKINIVTGYKSNKILYKNISTINNPIYNKSNMVYSLYLAFKKFKKFDFDLIISYSDIIYNASVLKKLVSSKENFGVVVDKRWLPYWKKRFDNPYTDAETCILSNDKIIELGQKVSKNVKTEYQYIGLIKIRSILLEKIFEILKKDKKAISINKSFKALYLTDLINYLITKKNMKISPIVISGKWLEIDNLKDHKIAKKLSIFDKGLIKVTR
jgi:choline kinase